MEKSARSSRDSTISMVESVSLRTRRLLASRGHAGAPERAEEHATDGALVFALCCERGTERGCLEQAMTKLALEAKSLIQKEKRTR